MSSLTPDSWPVWVGFRPPNRRAPVTTPLAWYEQPDAHDQIAELIAWLADNGQLGGVDEALHICREPWHYETERNDMLGAERRAA